MDQIYPVVLKKLSSVIANPLSVIFKKSFNTGIVPDEWKLANVTAVYKKGSKSLINNYRPISLTSQVCKIMETLVRDTVVEHLQKYKLIKDSQHGFMKGRSCLTNLLEFLERITDFIDREYPVDVLYLDFSKAFDKVPHKRLILKVKQHGIGTKISSWIKDWLTNRKQRVVVHGKESGWMPVKSGVPQGSVLGPTLFLIYINDIECGVASSVLKFADDTKIYQSVQTTENIIQLQKDLTSMYDWSLEWQMLLNADKCKCLHIGHNNIEHQYMLGGIIIESTEQEKDLGVIIQKNLDVSCQVAETVKRANRLLGMIKRIYTDKSKENILPLYKSLVRPHLEYAIQAWRPYKQKDIDNIEKIQRRVTKMIDGMSTLNYEERLQRTNLISLEMRRLRSDMIEVFKIMHGFEGLKPEKFFKLSDITHTRGHSMKIYKPNTRLEVRKHFFTQRVIDEWNNLPADVVQSSSVNEFKSKIEPMFLPIRGLYISRRRLTAPS